MDEYVQSQLILAALTIVTHILREGEALITLLDGGLHLQCWRSTCLGLWKGGVPGDYGAGQLLADLGRVVEWRGSGKQVFGHCA